MELRHKVVLLAVAPVIVVAPLLAFMIHREGRALADGQVAKAEQILLAAKQEELRHLVALARGAIRHLESPELDAAAARSRALETLRALDFGEDGYFYVYEPSGRNLMHARRPEIEGRDQWNLTDDTGVPIIQELIARARAGGGFTWTRWWRPTRPTQAAMSPKLSYVELLPHWGWVLGTGIYLDDVDAVTHEIRASSSSSIGHAMIFIAVIAVLAAAMVGAAGMALNVTQQRLADGKLQVLNRQLLAAQEAELAAQEEERTRVVLELHDDVLPDLTAIRIDLETSLAELTPQLPPGSSREMLEQSPVRLSRSIDEIRLLCRDLRPPFQADSLPVAIEQIVKAFSRRTEVAVTLDARVTRRPPAPAAMALLRVTKEALHNIERHARATQVTIRIAASSRGPSSGTALMVSDDGCGFDVRAVDRRPDRGIGLLSMRVRMEALGGELAIRSSPKGTEIEAFLPHDAPVEDHHHDGDDEA